ncbi:MAG: diphthine--ammonia ligase [Candidatus Nanoarchaeia archaeon]|nr:diphthine--ammonia ligase [Candidatus Nanoarchaeia archaeon]
MKLGILFSGGKDSNYAAYLAKKEGYSIGCLISIISENNESFMFHTPSISAVEKQAEAMKIPIVIVKTKGEKEKELRDLKKAIKIAIDRYKIEGIVTGAVESVYQASRIQKICNTLNIECFNPLWQKNQLELLGDLIRNKFEVIIVGVFAYPLDSSWLGKKIDYNFIDEIKKLNHKYRIDPAGEGGEFETFVLNSPLFNKKLEIKEYKDYGEKNSWRREIKIE